ncbi:MAG: 30S ribosomal protein S5 [Planctomycetota bacterium]|nr:MAG: 30S ribosomal protein S5 [Planctomycetota bacterium]
MSLPRSGGRIGRCGTGCWPRVLSQRFLRRYAEVSSSKESRGGEFTEKVVKVRRCATVVKGGRRFSFAGLVVIGNGRGKVGCGYGKANEVPPAVEKAIKDGMKNLIEVPTGSGTIPHRVEGKSGTSKVILLPASPGTGIIAGAAVRAVCESAGIRDVLTKAHGSTNPVNLVKAALDGLKQLRTRSDVERLRGVSLS